MSDTAAPAPAGIHGPQGKPTAAAAQTATQTVPGVEGPQPSTVTAVPPKVNPATVIGATEEGFVKSDIFYSFRGFAHALSYWMPKGLNESVVTARGLRDIVR